VPIGRLPEEVTAPFLTIRPAIAGTLRWAGATILVFTPNPATPLPNATRYDVTIAPTATAVSGRRLARAYAFSFVTPTVRLIDAHWYRVDHRFDRSAVFALRFNQAVRPADVLAHATARYERHEWDPPEWSAEERARAGAAQAARFDAKVAATAAVAASQAPIALRLAADWDKKEFPPSPDLVVLETAAPPSTDGWVRITVDRQLPGIEGRATPPATQSRVLRLDRTLFVDAFMCRTQCDADGYNLAPLRSEVRLDALRRATTIRDITNRAQEAPVRLLATPRSTYRSRQETVRVLTPEDLGFDRQAPARTWAYTGARSTARPSATPGPASSTTGTSARSRASAKGMASGKPAAVRCRSSRAISRKRATGCRRSRRIA
jgi:hypothetical protein